MLSFTNPIVNREVNLDGLSSGVYLLTLESENSSGTQRLVVE